MDTSEYDKSVNDVAKSGESLGSKLKSGLATAGKIAAAGITAIAGAATTAVGGLLSLESSTEEYRVAMGKLNTAFDASGLSADAAWEAYNGFYEILGDTDTATEASQLLAKLVDSEEEVTDWTYIAAGVFGTFGDSLPIEGLIESANETAKVGQVTGSLADALNWAGISEDEFNKKLESCTSESQRNQLIMDTLYNTYEDATDAFYDNNKALIQARDNQTKLTDTLSSLGQTVSNVKNSLMSEFLPSITDVASSFNGILTGAEGAEDAFSEAVQGLLNDVVEKLPDFLSLGTQILNSLLQGLIQALPSIASTAIEVVGSLFNSILEQLPMIMDAALQIILALVNGISENIPTLLPEIVKIIAYICTTLVEYIPSVINAAIQLLMGIVQAIPTIIDVLIDNIPEIINTLIYGLLDALPSLLDAAIQLLMAIVDAIPVIIDNLIYAIPTIIDCIIEGLLDALPQIVEAGITLFVALIEALPQIITTIVQAIPQIVGSVVNALIGNIDKIIMAGIQLFVALIANLPTIISEIVKAIPQIIGGIVQAVANGAGQMAEAGMNLLRGLWNGISNGAQWLWNQVSGWLSGLWNNILGFFGIHSPSTEMAWVGQMLVDGLSGSIKNNGKEAVKAAEGMASDISRAMDTLSSDMETTIHGEYAVNDIMGRQLAEEYKKDQIQGGWNAQTINITINGANYSDEEQLAEVIAEKIQNMKYRKEAVFA